MDNFPELFSGGDNWSAGDARGVRNDDISSVDSTTPPPQLQIEEKDDRKSANSIRGSLHVFYQYYNIWKYSCMCSDTVDFLIINNMLTKIKKYAFLHNKMNTIELMNCLE